MQDEHDHFPEDPSNDSQGSMVNPYEVGRDTAPPTDPSGIPTVPTTLPDPTSVASAATRPRTWTVVAIPLVSLATFFITSSVMVAIAFLVVHGTVDRKLLGDPEAMKAVSGSRIGLILLVVVPQLALVLPSVLAALVSPVGFAKRLSLVRGHWPIWAWIAAAAATPLVGWVSSIVVGSLMEESENLRMMSDIFRGHGANGFLIPLALLIGATPAICEELLFRGYVQTRLVRARGPLRGILVSSLLFAAFHMDWVHVVAVFPLGLYLGFVAWRSGSLLPAMLGHFVNNAISVFAVVLSPEDPSIEPSAEMVTFLLTVISAGLLGAALTLTASVRFAGPKEVASAPSDPLGPA
ncbi:CPBP family intramembrane metalloprotease [Roseiconus nitratireducens]|uniref:CPBP family intramembrane metalloprotease n=1 Tax=Roseiconus nitratireducens TaxID=2605748 RepID=A0A5M6D7I8_9BACT|nr:type II CAAX endopeptidase family protein [Roseiconus nitratireducens]KAA5542242.1 CPBP family intramembrane metalloprotease [Roseiconus nitratireducens]